MLDHQPARPLCLVSCRGGGGGAGWSSDTTTRSITGPSAVAARAPATCTSLVWRADPVHTARSARDNSSEWLFAFDIAARNRRRSPPRLTRPPLYLAAQVPCRDTRFRSFVGRHFALRTAGLDSSAAAPTTTTTPPHTCAGCREITVSRSGNCRLLRAAGAIPSLFRLLFLCYSCVILALFLRYSCVILVLFWCYSGVIPLLFWLYSFGCSLGTTPL